MWANTEERSSKRASWRRTWTAGAGAPGDYSSLPLTMNTDAGPRASWSHQQSPQSTRHTLDLTSLRGFVSKLSRGSRKRMSFQNYSHQDREEVVSPISASYSPRFPGTSTSSQDTHHNSDSAGSPVETDFNESMEGVQVIRADIEPVVHSLYESSTGRWQYLIADPNTEDAIITDPVLDRNPYASDINTTAADQILYLVRQYQYHVVRILETHSVPEHPTSAWYLRTQLRDSNGQFPRISNPKAIAGVQRMFAKAYGVQDAGWSARFDSFRDGQVFVVGEMAVQCIHLLSQPDWFGFVIGHNVFLGKEVPKDMTESAAVRPTQQIPLRKLARFTNGYTFYPQKQQPDDVSRSSTAQTEVSEWMHEPATPRASISMRRMLGRQHNNNIFEDASSISSRASSAQSHRRISQIPELA